MEEGTDEDPIVLGSSPSAEARTPALEGPRIPEVHWLDKGRLVASLEGLVSSAVGRAAKQVRRQLVSIGVSHSW